MDEMQNAVIEQTENVKKAAGAFEAQAEKAKDYGINAAKEMTDKMRALVEKSLHETRARYAKTKSAVEEASSAMETSLGAAREGMSQLNVKAIEALKSDAEAHFDLMTSLVSVKSMSDMITLNTEFVRKRFEEATARAKTFSEMARKIADETASPIREQVAKTAKFAA
jgi:phasin